MPEENGREWTFTVEPEDEGQRVDVYLASVLPSCSRSRIQALIGSGDIQLNGRTVKGSKKTEEGDRITCSIPDVSPMRLEPCPMELDICYEDAFLLVVYKPRGLVVHPAPGSGDATLVHGLLAHCGDLSGINGVLRPGIVHRLDKDTSGLMVIAKEDAAHRDLAEQIANRTMRRQYVALVWGIISEREGLIDAPVGRDPKDRQKMTVVAGGKEAQTSYTVLDRLSDKTVIQCDLHTGRTHQIRVHLNYLGHPVVGDPKYGRRKDDPSWTAQALHAWSLRFYHPVNGAEMAFFAPLPEGFHRFLVGEGAVNTLARAAELAKEADAKANTNANMNANGNTGVNTDTNANTTASGKGIASSDGY